MVLGFSGQALGGTLSFREICRTAKKYDMTTCEIWECNAEMSDSTGDSNGYSGRNIKKLAKIADDEGVKVECVTLGSAFGSASADSEYYAELLCSAVETAKYLGALRVNHYCASISPDPDNPDFKKMEDVWTKPLRMAEEYGIILALENEAHDSTCTPERMLKIINHFSSSSFKTNLDVTNYYQAGCDGFPDAYEILKSHIGYIHLKNARRSPDGFKYTTIPDGAVNIAGLLQSVKNDKSYDGLFSLEPHVSPDNVERYYKVESEWIRKLGFLI